MSKIEVEIKITKASVYSEVEKLTAYFGAKAAPDGTQFEQIAVGTKQEEMLDQYWTMGNTALVDVMKPYLTSIEEVTTSGSEYVTYTLGMPSNWNSLLKADLANVSNDYLIQFISGMWFRQATDQAQSVDNESKQNSDAVALLNQLRRKIYDRVRPTKPTYEDEDSSSTSSDSDTDSSSTTSDEAVDIDTSKEEYVGDITEKAGELA